MARKIAFDVHGKPQPAGSKRAFVIKGRAIVTDANKNSRDWKNQVSDSASLAYKGALITGPISLTVVFSMPRPKSHFTSKGKPSSQWRSSPTVKPDATKLLRGVEDAITGIIWRDDSQIVCQHVYKRYDEAFVTSISIEELAE